MMYDINLYAPAIISSSYYFLGAISFMSRNNHFYCNLVLQLLFIIDKMVE